MKALSLWQPWASAMAVGLKTIETRSWEAPKYLYGHRFAICAAKKNSPEIRAFWAEKVRSRPAFLDRFFDHRIDDWTEMPLGFAVCLGTLVRCVSTNAEPSADLKAGLHDQDWGDFSADRFGWFFKDIEPLDWRKYPVTGRQGIFDIPNL